MFVSSVFSVVFVSCFSFLPVSVNAARPKVPAKTKNNEHNYENEENKQLPPRFALCLAFSSVSRRTRLLGQASSRKRVAFRPIRGRVFGEMLRTLIYIPPGRAASGLDGRP